MNIEHKAKLIEHRKLENPLSYGGKFQYAFVNYFYVKKKNQIKAMMIFAIRILSKF